jgi:hypothetical protein
MNPDLDRYSLVDFLVRVEGRVSAHESISEGSHISDV